jgi:hypothetical protein
MMGEEESRSGNMSQSFSLTGSRTQKGFMSIDEEAASVSTIEEENKQTHWLRGMFSSLQMPNSIVILLVITVAVTLFGNLQSIPNNSENITEESPYASHWDAAPYRFDFLVTSPYGRSPEPFSKMFMPLYTSHPLNEPNRQITSVVISIHGYTRNAGHSLPLLSPHQFPQIFISEQLWTLWRVTPMCSSYCRSSPLSNSGAPIGDRNITASTPALSSGTPLVG